ncbi:hypothetical protein [Thioalkalivibrio thiocyanoxidans]|uniref:hypothetical protein n=1 Tax=Thioalkalivibrio thiocyanoxidans TaxID=152475 RepID=UPI00037C6B9D|nr:hypothetical protein [Thioalkalivibrio thiocyanoxidans]
MDHANQTERMLHRHTAEMFASEEAGKKYYLRRTPQIEPIKSFSEYRRQHDQIVKYFSERLNEAAHDPSLTTRDKALASWIEGLNLNLSLKALQAAGDSRWTILDPRVSNLKRGIGVAMELLKQRGCNA